MAAVTAFSLSASTFAYLSSNSLVGTSDEVTKIISSKTSYTLYNGDEPTDLTKNIIALVSNKQLADPASLVYTLNDTSDSIVSDDRGKVSAIDDKGSATMTVSNDSGKVKVVIKLTAAPSNLATGFKLEKTSYDFPIGGNGASIKVIPTPDGSYFDQSQINAIVTACDPPLGTYDLGPKGVADGKGMILEIVGTGDKLTSSKQLSVSVPFPRANGSTTTKRLNFTLKPVTYRPVTAIGNKGTLNIKVGEVVSLEKNLKYSSNATTLGDVTYSLDYYNNEGTYDYASFYDDEGTSIIGVAVGKLKVTATLEGNQSTSFTVSVSAYSGTITDNEDTKTDTKLNASSRSMAKGTTFTLAVLNPPEDAAITYSSVDSDIASVTSSGVIIAKSAGSTQIVATVDGDEYYCNVTVTASSNISTDVPQTGVAVLLPLF